MSRMYCPGQQCCFAWWRPRQTNEPSRTMLHGITVNKNLETFQRILDQGIVGVATWLLTVRSFHKERSNSAKIAKEENHRTTLLHRHLLKADLHLLWNEVRVVDTATSKVCHYMCEDIIDCGCGEVRLKSHRDLAEIPHGQTSSFQCSQRASSRSPAEKEKLSSALQYLMMLT